MELEGCEVIKMDFLICVDMWRVFNVFIFDMLGCMCMCDFIVYVCVGDNK